MFYDGPPFATGLPLRAFACGNNQGRNSSLPNDARAVCAEAMGWDCHLPIENLVEKSIGLNSKKK